MKRFGVVVLMSLVLGSNVQAQRVQESTLRQVDTVHVVVQPIQVHVVHPKVDMGSFVWWSIAITAVSWFVYDNIAADVRRDSRNILRTYGVQY